MYCSLNQREEVTLSEGLNLKMTMEVLKSCADKSRDGAKCVAWLARVVPLDSLV